MGVAGGLFMIPCESFIQVRPSAERKGAVIAASNFAIFTGILATGFIANALNKFILPTNSFLLLSPLAAAVGVCLWLVLPREDIRT